MFNVTERASIGRHLPENGRTARGNQRQADGVIMSRAPFPLAALYDSNDIHLPFQTTFGARQNRFPSSV
jgi:hypothetical protein